MFTPLSILIGLIFVINIHDCRKQVSCGIKDGFVEVKKDNCRVRHVPVKICKGCCPSYTISSSSTINNRQKFKSKGDCCVMAESEVVMEAVHCGDERRLVPVRSATKCLCSNCNA